MNKCTKVYLLVGVSYPDAKLNFPKLRGGTADSTLKFMLKLMDMVEKAENEANVSAFKEMLNGNNAILEDESDDVISKSRQGSATKKT